MKKNKKIYVLLIVGLIIIAGLIVDRQITQYRLKKTEKLVKSRINLKTGDKLKVCKYSKDIFVANIENEVFLIIKNNQIFRPRLLKNDMKKAEQYAPTVPLQPKDDIMLNYYDIFEFCRIGTDRLF